VVKYGVMTKHAVLCDVLKREIASDKFRDGLALPSESALVRRFGVSRITVQRALRDLEREGLIRKIPRKGAFVIPACDRNRTIQISFPHGVRKEDAQYIRRAAEEVAARCGYSVSLVIKDREINNIER